MPRRLTRFALIAVLLFGVVAMHSFGHSGSGSGHHGQIVVTGHDTHHGHATEGGSPPAEDDTDSSALLSALGLMACGALVVRFAFECLRSAAWSRLWDRLTTAVKWRRCTPKARCLPPPRLRPTGIQINRVAVLRI